MLTALTGYATARIIALAITGQPDPYNTAAITYEVTTALLAAWALTRPGR